jgi:hypothetical protein
MYAHREWSPVDPWALSTFAFSIEASHDLSHFRIKLTLSLKRRHASRILYNNFGIDAAYVTQRTNIIDKGIWYVQLQICCLMMHGETQYLASPPIPIPFSR